jgi:dTDP-4-amino-4,6-dideoxygalactose transaminase
VEQRDALRKQLEAHDIATAIHYPIPVHRMPAYAFLGMQEGSLPASERLAREILTLPLFPELEDAAVDRVCAVLGDAIA